MLAPAPSACAPCNTTPKNTLQGALLLDALMGLADAGLCTAGPGTAATCHVTSPPASPNIGSLPMLQHTVPVATRSTHRRHKTQTRVHTHGPTCLLNLQVTGVPSTAPLQSSGSPSQEACSALLVQWYVEAATPAAAVLVGRLLRDGAQGLLQQLQSQMDAAVSCVRYAASPGRHGVQQPQCQTPGS